MENFFQAIMYFLFGKRWLLLSMKHGLKAAIFVNEMEIDLNKSKIDLANENLAKATNELATLEATPIKEIDGEDLTQKDIYDLEQNIKKERTEAVNGLKNHIKALQQEVALLDGELSRVYSIAYTNRRKFDFVKKYQVKPTYADINQVNE